MRQETRDRRHDIGDMRQKTWYRIRETEDERQEIRDRRHETGEVEQETGNVRLETGD